MVFDLDRLMSLRDDIGAEDFTEIVLLFFSEIGEKLEQMGAAVAPPSAGDFHFLRGSAANLGFRRHGPRLRRGGGRMPGRPPPRISPLSCTATKKRWRARGCRCRNCRPLDKELGQQLVLGDVAERETAFG